MSFPQTLTEIPLDNLDAERRDSFLYHYQTEWFYLYGYCFDCVISLM